LQSLKLKTGATAEHLFFFESNKTRFVLETHFDKVVTLGRS